MNQKLEDYATSLTSPENEILYRIHRETYLQTAYPRMLSGHLQGGLLKMISLMIRPQRILEIGAFTGYSAICLAEGIPDSGLLETLEINPELEEMLLHNFAEAGIAPKTKLYIGDATQIIPNLTGPWDLVFLDADKEQYETYYDLVFDKVKKGGFILVDNVLWGGKVILPLASGDKETRAIIAFNDRVSKDERVECLVLPVRDGLMLLRKK
ncbi:MAG: O-methyltransferase [Bacteroidota bacterium]